MLNSMPLIITIRDKLASSHTVYFSHQNPVNLMLLLAITPMLGYVGLIEHDVSGFGLKKTSVIFSTILFTLAVLQLWDFLFSKFQPKHLIPGPETFLNAALFGLLLPLNTSIWLVTLSVSFGTVFGDRVFGGRGYSFLNPVTVGLAFYLYSNKIDPASTGANLLPMGLILGIGVAIILLELVSWRTLAGLGLSLISMHWLIDFDAYQTILSSNYIPVALLFLAADHGSGGSTNPSRWLHGIVCGLILALLVAKGIEPVFATTFAILLASLSAPLLDEIVVQIHVARRSQLRG